MSTRTLQNAFRCFAATGLMCLVFGHRAAAVCVADCDEKDGVLINEVVASVNIFLENDLVSSCPNADQDGDGSVLINEVVGAVNSFLDADTCPMVEAAAPTPTPTNPPTATATATAAATLTPTPAGVCGNGLLEMGETCESCAADCVVQTCNLANPAPTVTFRVNWEPPPGQPVSVIRVLVSYRTNLVSLPGSGTGPSSRIKNKPSNSITSVNDLNYGLDVLVSKSGSLPVGRLFTVDFDRCTGAAAPSVDDFSCVVTDCGSSFGPVDGCKCSVVTP